jgi:hypothetical protein
MTDDLVKRLRKWDYGESTWGLLEDAASRIEKLEAELHSCFHRIEELQAALEAVIRYAGNAGDDYLADQARKALEGKDD